MAYLIILPLVTVCLNIIGIDTLPIRDILQLNSADYLSVYSPQCEAWIVDQLRPYSEDYSQLTLVDIYNQLPSVSIIITFFNEAEGLIKRTLDCIWQRTPRTLIQEIILVDDASTVKYHFNWLPGYIEKVHLIRNPTREGLIVSRMNGARLASAKLLVFLDSHVEVDPGWLPALLVRLVHAKQSKSAGLRHPPIGENCSDTVSSEHLIVSPTVYDVEASEEIHRASTHAPTLLGGFTWNLTYRWEPDYLSEDSVIPRKTPAVSGGLFAVWRDSFFALGGYDERMRIWGGENVELSLRTWMCGGQMEIIPCSRVGHHFRKTHPYTFPDTKELTVIRNNKRVALVWFLSQLNSANGKNHELHPVNYLALFYSTCPIARSIATGSIASRRHLIDQLQCKSFTWYLNCIYPKLRQEIANIFVSEDVRSLAELEVDLVRASQRFTPQHEQRNRTTYR